MKSATTRGLLTAVAALAVLAVMAVPASATITPVNGSVTARSGNSALTRSGLGARCTTSTFAGRISADGRSASGNLDFSNRGATTCSGTFGVSCEVRSSDARNNITLRSTASTAGTSATGDVALDSDFTYSVSCLGGGLVCTVSGPQTIRAAGTIRQGAGRTDTLVADARRIACGEGGTADFTGTYTITEDLSIS
jgi:hypothetical protein